MPLVNPPPSIISGGLPRPVGGTPSAGASAFASAYDHVHGLVETSGPTNLSLAAWLDGETPRRSGGTIVGRQVSAGRLTTGPATTTSTSMADVGSQLNFALKANADYVASWVVYYQTADATTPIRLGLLYSGTLNAAGIRASGFAATGPTSMVCAVGAIDDQSLLGGGSVGPGLVDMVALIHCVIRTTTAGTIALRYRSGKTASSVTIQNGSHASLIQV